MAKFTKEFSGVKNGDIYPTLFKAGEACPQELEEGALSLGAISKRDVSKPAAASAVTDPGSSVSGTDDTGAAA